MKKNGLDSLDSRLRRHPLGFLQIYPSPSEEELKSYYDKQYYQTGRGKYRERYSDEEIEFINMKIEQRHFMVKKIISVRKGRLLDVGCGEGFLLSWFKGRGWKIEGIDFTDFAIKRMNPGLLPFMERGNIFKLLQDRIESGKKYDLLWLGNVLEHVVDPVALLASLRKITTKAGCIVITVPNDGSKYQEFLLQNGDIDERFWIAPPDHLAYFTYESLKKISEATGWHCSDILADFPIDLYLLHPGSNYQKNKEAGKNAHAARMKFELFIGKTSSVENINRFYSSLSELGFGRNLTAFLTPQDSISI